LISHELHTAQKLHNLYFNKFTRQEPDEDDLDDSDDEAGPDVAAARAAGIDVRGKSTADAGGSGVADGATLNVQELRRDAFWLQRRVSLAFSSLDADQAQQLAEKVFATLQVCLQRSWGWETETSLFPGNFPVSEFTAEIFFQEKNT